MVVSDNSSEDYDRRPLEALCAAQPAGTVEYVRPPEPLAMAAHWEWLWRTIDETIAPSHVAYLTDRLVFAAGALPQLVEVASARPGHVISYPWDSVRDDRDPVELVQRPWTGRLLELDSARLAALESRGEHGVWLPRLMDCVAPVAVVKAIERRFGDVFGDVAPDYRFAYRCLAVCDTLLYLDRSCVVEHGMRRSAGIGYLRGRMNADAADFAGRVTSDRFGATPEPAFETGANAIFQEYCAVRAELGGGRLPPVDRRAYLAANAVSVDRIADPDWRGRMRALLESHGFGRLAGARRVARLALEMAGYFARHPGALAASARRQLVDRPPGSALANVLPRLGLDPRVREGLTFGSSAEALAHADAHPRSRSPHAWHVHRLERAGAVLRTTLPPSPDGAHRRHPHPQPAGDRVRDAGSAGAPAR